jgi:cytoplasmic iron level regulating protein YaaA (DUF328/UPF0246 family)
MKILFSPSELKSEQSPNKSINQDFFIFPDLYAKRLEILNKFSSFVFNASLSELQNVYGTKDETECLRLQNLDLLQSGTIEAIRRYSGVAYEYLAFHSLNDPEKEFLYNNVIIFSNLFGPILAKDKIPYYKFKQASKIRDFKVEPYYKQVFSDSLNDFLKNEFIVDLRAGYYEKFYTLKQPFITMKFIKGGKVVSHWAKAYRGIVLRALALHKPNSASEFENIPFEHLKIKEIVQNKHKREYVFEIVAL